MRFRFANQNNASGSLLSGHSSRNLAPAAVDPAASPVAGQTANPAAVSSGAEDESRPSKGPFGRAFTGLYLFTLLLYFRPNDLLPIGGFPVVKIVTIVVILIFFGTRTKAKSRIYWTVEGKMYLTLLGLAVLFMPMASNPNDSWVMLTDQFIKTVIIFLLLSTVIRTRARLQAIWQLVVICASVLAVDAVKNYASGNLSMLGMRIEGMVGGIFENPNDLATALNLLVPLTVALTMLKRGAWCLIYPICGLALVAGMLVTFSRGGFLGFIALTVVMLWKFGRGKRVVTFLIAILLGVGAMLVMPGNYGERLSTIFNIEQDKTGSAQERSALLKRATDLAIARSFFGIGMGNMHIFSINERVAHNAYVEVWAELSIFGLLAYLAIIIHSIVTLRRIEKKTANSPRGPDREKYIMSVCLQASFGAYIICSFFTSIEYQWYLCYLAAYAVALRQIDEGDRVAVPAESASTALVPATRRQRLKRQGGILWNSLRTHKSVPASSAKHRG